MMLSLSRSALLTLPALAAAVALTGCSNLVSTAGPTAATGAALTGKVLGGQPPVTGSKVYLFAAGTTGTNSASTSLLTLGSSGVTTDAMGNGYVTTDGNGAFTISGNYACPSATSQVFLLAIGGNPGLTAGTSNSAITLMAGLGNCSTLAPTGFVTINEVTTAATVTALARFMSTPLTVGSTAANTGGMANAFLSIREIVDLQTGTARSSTPVVNGISPQAKLNTLGDILAPCVNSASNTSGPCSNLFSAASIGNGTTPTEVVSAMLLIARNQRNNVATLYQQINAAAPFQPMLSSAPNDYSLGVTYSGGGLTAPGSVVIDASGNAWVANCPSCRQAAGVDSLVGFSTTGAVLTGATGYTSNIHAPQGIAFDVAGALWSNNLNNGTAPDQVVKMSATTGAVAAGFPYSGATLNNPLGIALDSSNNAWVTNPGLNSAVKISPTGTTLATVTSPGFVAPQGIGIDGAGVVYAAGTGSSSILKFNSAGTVLNGPTGYTGGGISQPIGLAIDNTPHVWVLDNGTNAISEIFGTSGDAVSPAGGFIGGIYQAAVIAIAGDGTAWLANCRASCPGSGGQGVDNLLHFAINGDAINGFEGLQNTSFNTVGTVAIDSSGNLWVTNNGSGTVTKMIGIASPVRTPLAVAAANNQLGLRY